MRGCNGWVGLYRDGVGVSLGRIGMRQGWMYHWVRWLWGQRRRELWRKIKLFVLNFYDPCFFTMVFLPISVELLS